MKQTKSEANKKYYAENREKVIEKEKKNRNATKTYNQLLQELIDSRTKLEAQLLHGSMKGWKINPDHLVRLWRDYQKEANVFLTMDNLKEERPHFEAYVERVLAPSDEQKAGE